MVTQVEEEYWWKVKHVEENKEDRWIETHVEEKYEEEEKHVVHRMWFYLVMN